MKMNRDIYEWLGCIKRIYENNSGKVEEWDKWIGRVEKEINEIVNGRGYQFGEIEEDGIAVKKK